MQQSIEDFPLLFYGSALINIWLEPPIDNAVRNLHPIYHLKFCRWWEPFRINWNKWIACLPDNGKNVIRSLHHIMKKIRHQQPVYVSHPSITDDDLIDLMRLYPDFPFIDRSIAVPIEIICNSLKPDKAREMIDHVTARYLKTNEGYHPLMLKSRLMCLQRDSMLMGGDMNKGVNKGMNTGMNTGVNKGMNTANGNSRECIDQYYIFKNPVIGKDLFLKFIKENQIYDFNGIMRKRYIKLMMKYKIEQGLDMQIKYPHNEGADWSYTVYLLNKDLLDKILGSEYALKCIPGHNKWYNTYYDIKDDHIGSWIYLRPYKPLPIYNDMLWI